MLPSVTRIEELLDPPLNTGYGSPERRHKRGDQNDNERSDPAGGKRQRVLVIPTALTARATVVVLAVCAIALPPCGVLAASAQAVETSATIAPSLSPDRLGARARLSFTIEFAGGELGVPAPVLRAVLEFPAGLSLDIPELRSCSAARLEVQGASSCPEHSKIGSGHAVTKSYLGTQETIENVSLWAFLGPLHNLQATVEILGEGYSPFGEQLVLSANALANDRAPYGEGLELSIPPISTVPSGSDVSIVTFSLEIGTGKPRSTDANAVLVPSRCPAGGFPFAAEFTYIGGATGSAFATVPCPR
jgi:hypothetical protein